MFRAGRVARLVCLLLVTLAAGGKAEETPGPAKTEVTNPYEPPPPAPPQAEDFLLAPPALLLESAAGQRPEPPDPKRGPWNHANRAEGEWGSFNTRLLV